MAAGRRQLSVSFLSRTQASAFSSYIARCHSFKPAEQETCMRFTVDGQGVGWVHPSVAPHLLRHTHVFTATTDTLTFVDGLTDYHVRTAKVMEVMQDLRKEAVLPTLSGWRNEMFPVGSSFASDPLFEMERAATPLLGIKTYGCHINGYVVGEDGRLEGLWVAKRSKDKQTWPGCLDNVVAGGIPVGVSVWGNIVKECEEEASIPSSLAAKAKAVGSISYFSQSKNGLKPETQYVYDLVLPRDFQPIPRDGEVEEFYCWPIEKVVESIATNPWKANSAVVMLDFLIRHGIVTADNEPQYDYFVSNIHHNLS